MRAFIPQSIAHRTDLIFARFESEIEQYESGGQPYLCIRTPRRPDYFWGNTLLFSQPPQNGDFAHWQKLFHQHFPETDFMTFSWNSLSSEGEIQAFLDAGFENDCSEVLSLSRQDWPLPRPTKWNEQLTFRPVDVTHDWDALIDVHLGHWKLKAEHEQGFIEGQMKVACEMVQAGQGMRFAAFLKGQMVGDMGLYWTQESTEVLERLGRFHYVSTHRDFLRQGVCSSLMYHVMAYAFLVLELDRLVIVADADDFPRHIYTSVGFQPLGWQPGLAWHDQAIYGQTQV